MSSGITPLVQRGPRHSTIIQYIRARRSSVDDHVLIHAERDDNLDIVRTVSE